jgi:UDP-3-O-[3-hydroxymyristoyl] glucosamine N-acyltransferase
MTPTTKRTAGELAQYLGAEVAGDVRAPLTGVAGPESARPDELIYLDSPRHSDRAMKSAAKCVLAAPGTRVEGKTILEIAEPKFAFAKAAEWLLPRAAAAFSVHPTAIIDPGAKISPRVSIGPYVVVEDAAEIGAGTEIEAFCFVGRGARIGEECRLHPRVTLYAGAKLAARVEVHSGCVIGADGFGYVYGEGRHWKFPQIGTVEVGDDVEIGPNTTIDRGSLGATRIGTGVKIDNLVQIAHNVEVGDHSVIAAQTGVSGSSAIGTRVIMGGQVGVGDHCTIQDGAIVGAQAGIPSGKTIRGGHTYWGTPARALEKFKEQYGWLSRLPDLAARVKSLEERK